MFVFFFNEASIQICSGCDVYWKSGMFAMCTAIRFLQRDKQVTRKKKNLLFTLLKVQGLREKKKQSHLHPTELWRSPSCHGTVFFFKDLYCDVFIYGHNKLNAELWTYQHWFPFFLLLIYQCHRAVGGIMGNWVSTRPPGAYLCST